MFHCEIKVENSPKTCKSRKKPFASLPITTPWKYKVPPNFIPSRNKLKNYHRSASLNNGSMRQPVSNGFKMNMANNFEKQYYNFLRLMYLFPTVHPANIHGILLTCNYDIFRATDRLKRAMRLVKGSCSQNQNVNKYENSPHLNYQALQSIHKLNKFYSYGRNPQYCRNYFNLPLSINKPNSICMIPNCYSGPKTYIKYEEIPKKLYN